MALAVQANLVQLKVADAKRRGIPSDKHNIRVPAPGFVRNFRETLIDHAILATYPDEHVILRLREIWGQFCLLHWLFQQDAPPESGNFAALAPDVTLRCGPVLDVKHDEVHAILWLLRFEQRRRLDPEYSRAPDFAEHDRLAQQITVKIYNKPIAKCTNEELLHAACEYAGMLAALRWATRRIETWGDKSAMLVTDRPF